MLRQDWYLSSAGHEQSGVKLGSPLPKASSSALTMLVSLLVALPMKMVSVVLG
jgi:hypothetical protein